MLLNGFLKAMPRIFNFGSINIDSVYRVEHIARPGETVGSTAFFQGAGGKGFNQSVALARAGARVAHVGRFGREEGWLRDRLAAETVDVSRLLPTDLPAGQAIIQVERSGQNAILLHAGANHALTVAEVPGLFESAVAGDWFLAQNETSCVPEALAAAHARGLVVCFNPAPMHASVAGYPLEIVDWLIVNETEGAELSGADAPEAILCGLRKRAPLAHLVLTLGADGVWCEAPDGARTQVAAQRVEAVDTTAAGDAFIGYLLAARLAEMPLRAALERACRAAAVSVTRQGAADSIPHFQEIATL